MENVLLIPFNPARRMYWAFLLISAGLALAVVYQQNRKQSFNDILSSFWSSKYWFHKSSIVDLSFLLGNSIFRVFALVPLFGSKLLLVIMVSRWYMAHFDLPPTILLPDIVLVGLYTLTFFIVEDLSRFLLHVCLHKIPFLWRLHKVHHSAKILTPLTLHRIHPAEMLLYYARSFLVVGLVTGTFVYLFGARVSAYDILGVHALGFLFNAMGANLRHSHIWLSFGLFERLFISPAQHQIHHSRAAEHRDVNFGTCLTVWDQILRSVIYSGKRKKLQFGL